MLLLRAVLLMWCVSAFAVGTFIGASIAQPAVLGLVLGHHEEARKI
jgi:hypothetical protein